MINPDGAKNSVLPVTRDGIWKNRFFHPVFPAPTEFPSCLHPAPGAPSPWHMARKSGNFLKQSAGASLPERGTVENGAAISHMLLEQWNSGRIRRSPQSFLSFRTMWNRNTPTPGSKVDPARLGGNGQEGMAQDHAGKKPPGSSGNRPPPQPCRNRRRILNGCR